MWLSTIGGTLHASCTVPHPVYPMLVVVQGKNSTGGPGGFNRLRVSISYVCFGGPPDRQALCWWVCISEGLR